MKNRLFIAIDGPAASGKGTIAKLLGEKLELPVLYTGNIYRAIAYNVIKNNQNINESSVVEIAKNLKLSELDNPDLMQKKVGEYASIIGSYPKLREVTYIFQRNFINDSNGAVIEGRDIGTVICPEANFKFYLTADVEVRAKRRFTQQNEFDFEAILLDLKQRDYRDQNREIAPLKPAKEAIIIDSSSLDVSSTLNKIFEYIVS